MTDEHPSTRAQREAVAEAFDRNLDPLAEYAAPLAETGVDPFALFVTDVLSKRNIAPRTRELFDTLFAQWREHMATEGRHPACPNQEHVIVFIEKERDKKGNAPATIKEKLRKLSQAYEYWQVEPSFPHPDDYNPFTLAREKVCFEATEQKKPPKIPLGKLRSFVAQVAMIRARAILSMQLKLGLRATELCNITLGELDIRKPSIRTHYQGLGAHPMLEGRPNAVYIPHDRRGNKSGNPRVLPIDKELQELVSRWLRIRPNNGAPWLFLSQCGNQLRKQRVNELWKDCFHPEYEESANHRAVTSHYGRHRFTTYWRVEQKLERPLIKYMRGDRPDSRSVTDRDGIDEYIHTYYEDIEPIYRAKMFELYR